MTQKTSPVPKKKRLKEIADRLWSRAVKDDWNNMCAACGNVDGLNSHHLFPRHNQVMRHVIRNGICLCVHCHQFCRHISPHQNAAGWMRVMRTKWPMRHAWYVSAEESGEHRKFTGTTNAVYYCDVIRGLREYVEEDDFDRIVGIRFSAWLNSEKKET